MNTMFRTFNRRLVSIGLAVSASAAALATIRAKSVDNLKEELDFDNNVDSFDIKLNSNQTNNDFEANRSQSVINRCTTQLSQWRQINGIPGLVVGVSLKGHNVWIYSEGMADVENGVKCSDQTVMRIASISKSMTALMLAKLIQQNQIDLDQPIDQYLTKDQFPDKYWEGQKVNITLRQLASHLGGIRHYKKRDQQKEQKANTSSAETSAGAGYQLGEFSLPEYYLKETFPSVMDSLKLFKDDPLLARPGTQYNYTTFGYTLISAVIESVLNGQKFDKYFIKFLREELGLENTYLDQNDPIIYNRSHFYVKSGPTGRLINAPYVDNSYKWAGGGLLSNVYDLLKFGNIMLYSYKGGARDGKPGLIRKDIIEQMWTPAKNARFEAKFSRYGLGWGVIKDLESKYAFCSEPTFPNIFSHTGGAIGASSVILIEPTNELIVTIITNSQNVSGIYGTALDIAKEFTRKQISSQQLSKLLAQNQLKAN